MAEIVAIIILLVGLVGMSIIIFKKMPVLVEFSPKEVERPGLLSKIKKRGGPFIKKSFSKTSHKTKDYFSKLRQKTFEDKDKFSDDFWRKIRGGK